LDYDEAQQVIGVAFAVVEHASRIPCLPMCRPSTIASRGSRRRFRHDARKF
jgi:hypothetical protein